MFRDTSPEAYLHPSTYIPGYPANATELRLTLDAPDYATALAADQAAWAAVEVGKLYWIPGTRIIGAIALVAPGGSGGGLPGDAPAPECPPVLDCEGHGTMVASRGAGAEHALCADCKIVMAQNFEEGAAWLAAQPWIDAQSDSWTSLAPDPGLAQRISDIAAKMPSFFAAGNGLLGVLGGLGQPTPLSGTAGAIGIYAVGGHDNGNTILWSGSMPHIIADACWSWAAMYNSLDEAGPRVGSGTSAATPYAAGEAARLILEARKLLGDPATGVREGGVLAQGDGSKLAGGPLADGSFTMEELRALVLHTADPRPPGTEDDGDLCGPETTPYDTTPIAWSSVPAEVPLYYLVGYGGVNVHTLDAAMQVLQGAAPLPDRSDVGPWPTVDDTLRDALRGV